MSAPVYNDKIAAQGLARLTSAFINQPNIRALVWAYLQPAQDLENTIFAVMGARVLATATLYQLPQTNAVLDLLGALVGQGRSGLSDSDYQSLIYLRIAVNRATGAAPDWSRFAAILLRTAAGPVKHYDDQAGIYFGVWGMTLNPNLVASLLAQAVGNGIYGVFAYTAWPDGADFSPGSVYDPAAGELGWGSVYTTSVGGLLVAGAAI